MEDLGSDINLAELRYHLTGRSAMLVIAITSFVMWISLRVWPLPRNRFILLAAMLILAIGVRALVKVCPEIAKHLLIWGLVAGLWASMWLFATPWLPFLGLLIVFITAMLVSGGGFVTAVVIAALSTWLNWIGVRQYPLTGLLVCLACGVGLSWLAVRTTYTALEWAWTMQERADRLLQESRDRQGELARALRSLDLTNHVLERTQRELISARRQAEEARITKEQFAANVSHELRTPLNLILGFSEMMHLSPDAYGNAKWPPRLRRAVYQIYRSSRHLLSMINDVLDLSRLEIAGFSLNKEPVQLSEMLMEALDISRDLFHRPAVRLEAHIPPDLPTLRIDRVRIRQVVLNLLNNAARFTEEGVVSITAEVKDGEVLVSVSDTGPGISPEDMECIFDEFYQVDRSLHRKSGGVGLGLAISKHFTEAHDGRIWAESEIGVGSTFHFALPIAQARLSRIRMGRLPARTLPDELPPVLVVARDMAVTDMIARSLDGRQTIQVTDVDQLPQMVTLHHPQLVVWNVLPGQPPPDAELPLLPTPILQCSLPSQIWLAESLSTAGCLTKPVTARCLQEEIARLGWPHDVLVVDDERGFCQMIKQMLEIADPQINVRQAYDGHEALAVLAADPPDLVLLDLLMPGLDGFHVLEAMQQELGLTDVPVVLLTASGVFEDALVARGSQIQIRRLDRGLRTQEILSSIKGALATLSPDYDERHIPVQPLTALT